VLEEVVQLRAALDAMRAESARVAAIPVPAPVDREPVDPEPVDPETVDPEPAPPVVVKRRTGGLVGRARDWLS
jgi:hypothetical protein